MACQRSARRPKQRSLRLMRYCEPMWRNDCRRRRRSGWAPVPGPAARWKGRRHGPRKHRRWANAWSPEQIACRLPVDFPDDETMRISHEAVYQALSSFKVVARCAASYRPLADRRVLRTPRARTRGRGKTFISPEIMMSRRPAEAADRACLATGKGTYPGPWHSALALWWSV